MSQCAVASGDCDHDILMKFLLLGDTGLHFSMANVLVLLVEFKLHYSYCGGGAVVVRRCWKIVFAPALCRWHLCSKLSLHLDLQKQKSLNVSHSNGDLCPKWFKIYALSDPPCPQQSATTEMEFNQKCRACCGRYNRSGFPNPTFDTGWDETWIVKCQSFTFFRFPWAKVFGQISSLCTRGLSNCMCGTWLDSCAMVSAIHPSGPFEASTCARCCDLLQIYVILFGNCNSNICPVSLSFDKCQLLMVCKQNWGGVIVFWHYGPRKF